MGKSFLAGLIVGLVIGGTAGFFIGHFWGWLVIGLAIIIALAAWWRFRRPRLLSRAAAE